MLCPRMSGCCRTYRGATNTEPNKFYGGKTDRREGQGHHRRATRRECGPGDPRGQVPPQASFIEDLGADSLDIVELVMAFEEEFGVEVPDEDAEKLQTVGDVIKYIEEKASKQQ